MHKISQSLAVMVLASLGTGIASANTLTYTFTGVVTGASGGFLTYDGVSVVGDTVTGTYVFDYAAALPGVGTYGTPGISAWSSTADFPGNFPVGGSLSGNLVFTSTAQVVGTTISYATTAPSPGYDIGSSATGYNNGGSEFAAQEIADQATPGLTSSSFVIGGMTPGQVFDSSGGPVYPPSLPLGAGSGSFQVEIGAVVSTVGYAITSISPPSPVPLPASAWLILSGVIGLGAIARRRRTG
jgi:hypothetical protein